MGKLKRLISNTAILGAGTFASKVLVLLLMPFYTWILSPSDFGTADLISQTANLLIPLAAVGICDGIFRFILDDAADKKKILSTGMAILLAGSAAIAVLAQFLRFFNTLGDHVFLIIAYVLAANVHLAFANYIRAEGKNPMFALQGIANTALTIGLNLLFLLVLKMGSTGYVLSVVVADACISVALFFIGGIYKNISFKAVDKEVAKQMLKFSIPYIPTTIMWLITSVSDRYIVTAYRDTAENGLYAAAYKLPTMLSLVSGVFIEAWHFSAVKDGEESERSRFFGMVYDCFMSFMFFCGSVIIACAQIFTKILLADSYFESWTYVPVLVIATVFSTLVSFLGSVYFLKKKSALSMLTAMVGAVANIALNFILIPVYGAMGAAAATLVCYVLVYVIRAVNTKKYVAFDLHTVRAVINTLLLAVQTAAWFVPFRFAWIAQIIVPIAILLFNVRGVIKGTEKLYGGFLNKIFKKN